MNEMKHDNNNGHDNSNKQKRINFNRTLVIQRASTIRSCQQHRNLRTTWLIIACHAMLYPLARWWVTALTESKSMPAKRTVALRQQAGCDGPGCRKCNQEIIKYLAVVINVGTNSLIALSHFSVLYCFSHSFLLHFTITFSFLVGGCCYFCFVAVILEYWRLSFNLKFIFEKKIVG